MPVVQVNIIEGRSEQQKERLIKEVTDAVHRSIDAPIETVRVLITEMPSSHWGIGGKTAKSLGR
jgi:4-oxalocrotonate tautomerase